MKRAAALIALFVAFSAPAIAHTMESDHVAGDFSMNGFVNVAVGWQRFSDDPVTEHAQAGFKPCEACYNDAISWSILWRALVALGVTTGARLSMGVNDRLSSYLAASNGLIRDVIPNFSRQSNAGNALLNLTGAKQHIHEISLGGAYYVADSAKIKFEWRTDIIDPAAGNTQLAYGAAAGFAYAF